MSDAPIIIVGVGRSGTSLLQSMLASHPELAFPPETSFLRRLVATGRLARAMAHGGEGECVRLLEEDEYVRRTRLEAEEVVQHVRGSEWSPGSLYRALLELYAQRESKVRYGDKDPRLVEFLPLVWEVLPDAKVIQVVRDPRDVLASKKKAAWSRGKGVLRHIFANRVQLKMGQRARADLHERQYRELVYEELLDNPELELKRFGRDFDVTFCPEMLRFGEAAKGLVSEDELSWKRETFGPLLNENRGKWKTELSDWEVALTELACSSHFNGTRYARSGRIRDLAPLERLSVYVAWLGLAAMDPVYRSYRACTVRRARKYL